MVNNNILLLFNVTNIIINIIENIQLTIWNGVWHDNQPIWFIRFEPIIVTKIDNDSTNNDIPILVWSVPLNSNSIL